MNIHHCWWCGASLDIQPGRRDRRYCNSSCRSAKSKHLKAAQGFWAGITTITRRPRAQR